MITPETLEAKRHQRAVKFGLGGASEAKEEVYVRKVFNKQDEKAQARAVRFGLVSDSMGSANHGSEEEQRKKARAERFANQNASSDTVSENEKRKIRLARFGANTENTGRRIINTAVDENKRFKE